MPPGAGRLGEPRHHFVEVGSTNDEARRLATDGAPHGTTVTATSQTAGRGRQGRVWVAPAGQALTVSIVLRGLRHPALLPLAVAVAVAETVGDDARIKWPNDVVFVGDDGALRKVAGILCEGRPAEGWAVAGIGLNVALDLADVPDEVAARAATMGRSADELEPVLAELLERLTAALDREPADLLHAWSARDVLAGAEIAWERPGGGDPGAGVADGVDAQGRLLVRTDVGVEALDAGEVHLVRR
ncbi:biotin--[acetyl-CoA-carboxylase] ligase [Patulibacter americanus]|uniref:biotin--[acetyl-CoA-carboxylase] ligase n=1 Tax=Patulibacter americanus TaxID=588672 RepID=UPI00146F0CA0|nr:biotin--[acetyl-CoA-carboxylase] ligase [Patulibacter americanus]